MNKTQFQFFHDICSGENLEVVSEKITFIEGALKNATSECLTKAGLALIAMDDKSTDPTVDFYREYRRAKSCFELLEEMIKHPAMRELAARKLEAAEPDSDVAKLAKAFGLDPSMFRRGRD